MKTTKLICQLPGCGDEYDSRRNDSKYCSKRHRTAAWRLRILTTEQPSSLTKFGAKDCAEIRKIKKELLGSLILIQAMARRETIPILILSEVYQNLAATIQVVARREDKGGAIHEHVLWIWEALLPLLAKKLEAAKRSGESDFSLRLSSEIAAKISRMTSR